MAIATMLLDPNATALTDDEVVNKINTATVDITRAGSVDPSARPIEPGEVTNTELAAGVAKDNLKAMAANNRGFVATDEVSVGKFRITSLQRDALGNLDVEYDDVANP